MDKYKVNSELSFLINEDIANYQEDVYVMVRVGNQVNALNYSAGCIFKNIIDKSKNIEEIIFDLRKEFGLCEDIDEDVISIINDFLEREWIIKC